MLRRVVEEGHLEAVGLRGDLAVAEASAARRETELCEALEELSSAKRCLSAADARVAVQNDAEDKLRGEVLELSSNCATLREQLAIGQDAAEGLTTCQKQMELDLSQALVAQESILGEFRAEERAHGRAVLQLE